MRKKNLTLAEGLELYREKVSILKKGYTQESYRIAHILRAPIATKTMREISSPDIADYRDDRLKQLNQRTGKSISPATVRLEMSLLSNVFDIGRIEWGTCDSNPVANVRKPKSPPGRDRRLLPREERLILRYCHGHQTQELYSIVILALETAMRQGEILKLEWEHTNLRNRIAHLPETKNGSKRDVPLSIKARDALIRLGVKTKGRVFNYTSNGLKSAWRIMMLRLEIEDLHFHDLRHEACTRLFELGTLDVMEIAAISGHKSLAMLKRYTHLQASKLVKKLEGNKHRGQQVVINHLVPYPAIAQQTPSGVLVRVLDFEGVQGQGQTSEIALQSAQDALLRHLMVALRDKRPIPAPDQYLETVNEADIIMLDPLCMHAEPPSGGAHTFLQ
ncbi:tyrosine-type recombinase/integrase [Pseudomonas aeruginosa]|uniref:tyrosine-type recombinase/integrase n=1 Tax=Pseudomonas aeruginosa TaxID=287 RepID=UPI0005F251BF|nr:tyrosine-type recombinase/integrase [Pseudomonas aeruginosa]KJS29256.1 MAG: DNA recombinase [Pseudomonas sp. BRH_c35]EKY4115069.1 tyrosine-type recombinase/integrase [Pseudomonas aeruginosa]ELJ2279324.1 tyrosine-type recombinase/integrase [Pseudomonas aeruginosa]MBS2052453.1 integrase [Pseudomonas aeruginosa]MCS8383245.1 tyrosine-type recombinase/integrase [Pseudomonas aeruginosa]